MRYVNISKAFYFKDLDLKEEWAGKYEIEIQIGDDNWRGPLVQTYSLKIEVKVPPRPIIVEAPVDNSFKGAAVKKMGITGAVNIKF